MNATAEKFGHPATLVRAYERWLVLLRPQQVTLGSLVLLCTEPVVRLPDASAAAFAELRDVVAGVERALARFVRYEKINYLMLMMVDPDVHWHVIPRYATPRRYADAEFADHGWPGPPTLGRYRELDAAERERLTAELRAAWG